MSTAEGLIWAGVVAILVACVITGLLWPIIMDELRGPALSPKQAVDLYRAHLTDRRSAEADQRGLPMTTVEDAVAQVLDLGAIRRLTAAPATYALPPEPGLEVTELWTASGLRAARCTRHPACWVLDPGSPLSHYRFAGLLTLDGPLSATPPTADAEEAQNA